MHTNLEIHPVRVLVILFVKMKLSLKLISVYVPLTFISYNEFGGKKFGEFCLICKCFCHSFYKSCDLIVCAVDIMKSIQVHTKGRWKGWWSLNYTYADL